MYCPVCFADTLYMKPRGVITTIINGKQMNTGRFLFNDIKDSHTEMLGKLKAKVEEFFKWYSSFQNKDPITKFGLYSSDFSCKKECKIPINTRISIIGILFTPDEVNKILLELGTKYKMKIELQVDG